MNHDPLSDVLCSVRLRGAVFYYVSCRDEWVAASPAARDIADVVMPGAEHVLGYHLIVKGSSWAATEGLPPVRLNSGDIVVSRGTHGLSQLWAANSTTVAPGSTGHDHSH